MPTIINQYRGKVVQRVIGATETIVPANTAIANTGQLINGTWGESVSALHITRVMWSGNTTIARGANTVLVLTGEGDWALSDGGISLTEDETANVVITAAAGATAIVEMHKVRVDA